MRRVLIRNPDLTAVEKTFLTADYTTGTSLSVVSSSGFAANDITVVGNPAEEKTEIKKITAIVDSNTLTLASALNLSHIKDTPIYRSPWDNVEISSNPGTGFSVISTSGLQFDKQYTVYIDASGSSNISYRWRFQNSVTGAYSEYSPTYSGAGFNPNQTGYMIQEVRKLTNTDGDVETIKDYEIVRALNAATDIIYGLRRDWWFLRFDDSPITGVTTSFRYNLDALKDANGTKITLGRLDRVRYHFVNGAEDVTYDLEYKSPTEFNNVIWNNNRQPIVYVAVYTIRPPDPNSVNGYIEIFPTIKSGTSTGTLLVCGFVRPPYLNDSTDATAVPIPHILEDYAISVVERIRGNDSKAEYYEELFYGPPPGEEAARRTTGIALLEQLQSQAIPVASQRQLWRFRGQRIGRGLYGDEYIDPDYIKTNYF